MKQIDNLWVLRDASGKLFITAAHTSAATTRDGETFTAIGPRFSSVAELRAYTDLLIAELRELPPMAERMT